MVDELERAAEPARSLFGDRRFAALRSADLDGIRQRVESLAAALDPTRESGQGAMARLLRDPAKNRRFERIGEISDELLPDSELLGIEPPNGQPGELNVQMWKDFQVALAERLEWAGRVRSYGDGLERLRAARPLEHLACELTGIAEESARNSLELWQSWLRLWPSRWRPEQRKLLSEYCSLLQMIASGDRYDEGAGAKVFRRYYSLFPQVAKILPAWAVTSLSARGRLPFEPGFFDLSSSMRPASAISPRRYRFCFEPVAL